MKLFRYTLTLMTFAWVILIIRSVDRITTLNERMSFGAPLDPYLQLQAGSPGFILGVAIGILWILYAVVAHRRRLNA